MTRLFPRFPALLLGLLMAFTPFAPTQVLYVNMPVGSTPPGDTWRGALGDAMCVDPGRDYVFAFTQYSQPIPGGATSRYQLNRINVANGGAVLEQTALVPASPDVFSNNLEEVGQGGVVCDCDGFVYVMTKVGSGVPLFYKMRVHKLDGLTLNEVATSPYTGGSFTSDQDIPFMRLSNAGGNKYIIVTSRNSVAIYDRTTMALVTELDNAVGMSISLWTVQRAAVDSAGNLWLGSYAEDLVKVTVPGGVETDHLAVWPQNPNVFSVADDMWYDQQDDSLIIGDESRTWRKISLATLTQTATLEPVDWPDNLYSGPFDLLQYSKNQQGQRPHGNGTQLLQTDFDSNGDQFILQFDGTLAQTADLTAQWPNALDPTVDISDLFFDDRHQELWTWKNPNGSGFYQTWAIFVGTFPTSSSGGNIQIGHALNLLSSRPVFTPAGTGSGSDCP